MAPLYSLTLKLLLVSEDPDLRDVVSSLVRYAASGKSQLTIAEGLDACLQMDNLNRFDVILLEGTHEVLTAVESLAGSYTNGSIIVLTENAEHALGLACVRAGAHDYIPLEEISPGALFRTLRYAVERRRAQQTLQSSQSQLAQAQKMEAIGRMASGLAHDFRQFVQVIVGNAKTLKRLIKEDETISTLVDDISNAGYGASELIGQVLGFARAGPAKQEEIDLNTLIENNRSMVVALSKKRPVTFDYWAEPLLICADTVQLGQILLNLTINAFDASEGRPVTVATRCLELERRYTDKCVDLLPGAYAVLMVSDQGTGIPKSVRRKLFDPFFTTKPKGKGTGLGLSTVYSIVNSNGGRLAYWTKEGEGTTFAAFLPMPRELEPVIPPLLAREVCLVLEDRVARLMVHSDLELFGCNVHELQTMEQAAAWKERYRDGLVFVDLDSELCYQEAEDRLYVSGRHPQCQSRENVLLKPYSRQELYDACAAQTMVLEARTL